MSTDERPGGDGNIDLAEVKRLLTALEADLAQVQSGSKDVQTLRDEVEALSRALHAGDAVAPQLRKVHSTLDDALDALEAKALVPADYIARIGRLLGM